MSKYYPDRWIMIDYGEEYGAERYAVLASWYGGFAGSDYWRRSSPIVSIELKSSEMAVATTRSGSQYFLHQNAEGQSLLISQLLANADLKTADDLNEVIEFLRTN